MDEASRSEVHHALGQDMSFNRATLNSYLKESDKTLAFGEVMNFLVTGKFPTEDMWTGTVEKLRSLLELGELNDKAAEFVAYDDSPTKGPPTRIFRGIRISMTR